jgi:thioesterase domain-containing protein
MAAEDETADFQPSTIDGGSRRLTRESFGLPGRAIPPASGTERWLLELWERLLDVEGLGVEDDFFELGGDSVVAVALFRQIERDFGQAPPLAVLLEQPTARRLAAYLERLRGTAEERPVVAIRRTGRRPPLFFMHAAWGNVLFVRRLAPLLDPEQPLYGIQARGLEPGETPHRRFDELAADFIEAIRRVQPRGPYYLAGYCVGCYGTFEIARQLRSAGEEVASLILVDPDVHPAVVPWLHWARPDSLGVRLMLPVVRLRLAFNRRLRIMTGRERIGHRKGRSATDLARERAIRDGLLMAARAFRPQPYDGPVDIICLPVRRPYLASPAHGWPSFAPRAEFYEVAGGHEELFRRNVMEVAGLMRGMLERAQGRASQSGAAPGSVIPGDRAATA